MGKVSFFTILWSMLKEKQGTKYFLISLLSWVGIIFIVLAFFFPPDSYDFKFFLAVGFGCVIFAFIYMIIIFTCDDFRHYKKYKYYGKIHPVDFNQIKAEVSPNTYRYLVELEERILSFEKMNPYKIGMFSGYIGVMLLILSVIVILVWKSLIATP